MVSQDDAADAEHSSPSLNIFHERTQGFLAWHEGSIAPDALGANSIDLSAEAKATTVICPDKDADGLTSGVILHRTLRALGLPESRIHVHLQPKGETVHIENQRAKLATLLSSQAGEEGVPEHRYLFVLDQGTAASPALASPSNTTTLVIDHHFSTPESFPEASLHINASHSPPVATTSLLVHILCSELYPALEEPGLAWLAAVGTHGDLGNTLQWVPPFPDMTATFRVNNKKSINDAVSLLNAPRRTSKYDVISAWTALVNASSPSDILKGPHSGRLLEARAEVNAEVQKWGRAPPKFAMDGSIAVIRIDSKAQVHPVIATRWAGTLKSKKLRIVMCANTGHIEGMVNFSCRIAKCAIQRVAEEKRHAAIENGQDIDSDASDADTDVDIIAELKALAARHPSGTLRDRLGTDFARGHVQASGGIVGAKEFEELMEVLRVGEKPPKVEGEAASPAKGKSPNKAVEKNAQKNTLTSYFGKAG